MHALLTVTHRPRDGYSVSDADESLDVATGTGLTDALDALSSRGWSVVSSFAPAAPTAVFVLARADS